MPKHSPSDSVTYVVVDHPLNQLGIGMELPFCLLKIPENIDDTNDITNIVLCSSTVLVPDAASAPPMNQIDQIKWKDSGKKIPALLAISPTRLTEVEILDHTGQMKPIALLKLLANMIAIKGPSYYQTVLDLLPRCSLIWRDTIVRAKNNLLNKTHFDFIQDLISDSAVGAAGSKDQSHTKKESAHD